LSKASACDFDSGNFQKNRTKKTHLVQADPQDVRQVGHRQHDLHVELAARQHAEDLRSRAVRSGVYAISHPHRLTVFDPPHHALRHFLAVLRTRTVRIQIVDALGVLQFLGRRYAAAPLGGRPLLSPPPFFVCHTVTDGPLRLFARFVFARALLQNVRLIPRQPLTQPRILRLQPPHVASQLLHSFEQLLQRNRPAPNIPFQTANIHKIRLRKTASDGKSSL